MIYVISKLVAAFFLPPGLFVLMFGVLYLRYKKPLLLFFALFVWILSLKPLGNFLLEPLESFSHKGSKPQAVVILGGGKVSQAKNLPTSASGTKRILYGMMLAKKHNLPIIITGCEGPYALQTAHQIAKSFGLDLNITIEPKSRDTYENALFTKGLLGAKAIFLVTSAYHMPRSYYLFHFFGFDVTTAPTDYKIDWDLRWKDFLPSFKGLQRSFTALHEYLGIMSLYLRGIKLMKKISKTE